MPKNSGTASTSNEARYYEALHTIKYSDRLAWLRKNSEKEYGLTYEEALEMAYQNLQTVAANAIKGRRPPEKG